MGKFKPGQSGNPNGQKCNYCGKIIHCRSQRQYNRMKQFPNNNRYCSRECYYNSMKSVIVVPNLFCAECGTSLVITRKQYAKRKFREQKNHFCNYKCMSLFNSKKRARPYSEKIKKWTRYNRNGWELQRLKKRISDQRGNYCEICLVYDNSLVMHHIKPFKENKELGYIEENVVLLCKKCHTFVHLQGLWNNLISIEEITKRAIENGRI